MKSAQKKSFLLLCIVFFFWYAQYIYIPYQTPYLAAINLSTNVIGVVVSAYGLSQLFLRLPVGLLANVKEKHKIFIIIGAFFAGIASVIRIIEPNGSGFLIGNIISGFASAMWISFMVLFLGFYPKSKKGYATSLIIMVNNLGVFLAFLTSTLLYDYIHMGGICLLSCLSGLVAFILAIKLKYPEKIHHDFNYHLLFSALCNRKLLFFSFLALIQQGIQMSTTMSFTNQILSDLGGNASLIGISSMVYMLSSVLFSKLAATKWINLLSISGWVIFSFLLLALYCILVPQVSYVYSILLLQIIPGIGTGILFSFLNFEAMIDVPSYARSAAMGLFQAIYALGMTLFPIIFGMISLRWSMTIAYFSLASIAMIAAILSIIYCLKFKSDIC